MAELNLCYIYILFIIYQIKNLNIYILNIRLSMYSRISSPNTIYYLIKIKKIIYGKIINNLCI